MRTILLTFSPNMTLINEAMRFHHTFNNLGWVPPRDPSTNNFLHSSSLSSHLTCLPTSLSNENLLGACCTFEQCRLNVLFMFKKKKVRGRHRWAWKEDANNSSGSRDIKCYSWLKGKPQDDSGPCSFPLASASPEPQGRPPRVQPAPLSCERQLHI